MNKAGLKREVAKNILENMFSRTKWLTVLCDAMELDTENISENTKLEKLENGWDSINKLSVMLVIDEYAGKSVSPKAINDCNTMGDLIEIACKVQNEVIKK